MYYFDSKLTFRQSFEIWIRGMAVVQIVLLCTVFFFVKETCHWNRYSLSEFIQIVKREREKSGKIYWLQLHCTYSSYTFNFCIVSCDEHIYLYFGNVGKLFSCLPMLILVKFFFAALLCCCFLSFSLVNKTLDAIVVHCNERLLQLNLCIWKCCTIEIS